MIAAARQRAAAVLLAVARGHHTLADALERERTQLDDPRDRALLHDLVTGTLRWQGALDVELAAVCDRPLARLDDTVRVLLRLGAYQLRHLTRVPPSAVVHDSVALARRLGVTSAAGFVNAVLRRLAVPSRPSALPARPEATVSDGEFAHWLALTGSHPEWLVARWTAREGRDAAEACVCFNNTPAAPVIRVNRLVADTRAVVETLAAEGVDTRPCLHAPDGLYVVDGDAARSSVWASGACFMQDEASQLVPDVLGVQPGDRVLDLCAAPGGKTAALAARCGDSGRVVACDVRSRRLRVLASTVRRLHASRVDIVQVPASGPLPFQACFDRVLVDAPCSGLGTVRRDPDVRWRRSQDDLGELAMRQHDLLVRAAAVLRPGGTIVYATCSSEPEENDDVIQRFLRDHPLFRVVSLCDAEDVPAGVRHLASRDGILRLSPARHGLEAFFAARLVLQEEAAVR